jgi:hypothetical protein
VLVLFWLLPWWFASQWLIHSGLAVQLLPFLRNPLAQIQF